MVEISASILAVEKEKSIKKFYELETAKIDYFHIDVMDGKFVPKNTTAQMIEYSEYLKQISSIPLDVHLMVEDVKTWILAFLGVSPNIITFHIEALKNKEAVMNVIKFIKENGIKVGISVKPNTSIEEIYEFLPYIHMVLVMTVEPGLGGQSLIPETLDKVRKLKEYITKNNIEVDIEVDGGIKVNNIQSAIDAGIDIAVVGTGLTSSENMAETMKQLKSN